MHASKEILEDFKSIKDFYNANILDWKMSSALVPKQINKLEEISLDDVRILFIPVSKIIGRLLITMMNAIRKG